ncbi:MAG: hypothetical protein MUF25_16205, partial [Pirellulaceae bacterium]|nr:hypothetical protein [Pirellulaceae bacterium]
MPIQFDIAGGKGRHRIASAEHEFQRPTRGLRTALARRLAGRLDGRVWMHALVAVIQAEKNGHRLRHVIGDEQQQVDPRRNGVVKQANRDFLAGRQPFQRPRFDAGGLESQLRRHLRRSPVDVGGKRAQDLRPADLAPRLGVSDCPPVETYQRIGQHILRHLGLVVIRVRRLLGRSVARTQRGRQQGGQGEQAGQFPRTPQSTHSMPRLDWSRLKPLRSGFHLFRSVRRRLVLALREQPAKVSIGLHGKLGIAEVFQ